MSHSCLICYPDGDDSYAGSSWDQLGDDDDEAGRVGPQEQEDGGVDEVR